MSVTINIGGDFCITSNYVDKELVSAGAAALFNTADFNIVNLECPVNIHGDQYKIIKHGPHLQTTEKIFSQLKALNVDTVTLANNHILDYGIQGLQSTVDACNKHGLRHVGTGNNLQQAATFIVLEKNGLKIAVINCCENEWSIATDETPGANPLDVIENLRQIKKAKDAADKVMVIVHGGNEYYNLPSPRMVKQYRFFAENGADAVIGHHTHCISGYEVHNGVPIFYGLGNLLFTKKSDQPGWFTGLVIQLTVEQEKPVQFRVIPTQQATDDFKLTICEEDKKQAVLNEVEALSATIANDKKLKASWDSLITGKTFQYLYNFSSLPAIPGRYPKSILKRLGFVERSLPPKHLAGIINYISCEAHLDVATAVLKKKLNKK